MSNKQGYIIPPNYKVRFITLGCGEDLLPKFMGEGSSVWLYSTTVLYAKEATEGECDKNNSSFVSFERLEDLKSNYTPIKNVITIFITASLSYDGQREDRVNHAKIIIEKDGHTFYKTLSLDNTINRINQEKCITEWLCKYFITNTHVIYAGSFNPIHEAHIEVIDHLTKMGYSPILQISNTHPVKGDIPPSDLKSRVTNCKINIKRVLGSELDVNIVNEPYYIDKYNSWKSNNRFKHQDQLIFVVGIDVWNDYKEEFSKEFQNIDDVRFLVFNRFNNKINTEELKNNRLLHPQSFKSQMINLNISSTEIRNKQENEKTEI